MVELTYVGLRINTGPPKTIEKKETRNKCQAGYPDRSDSVARKLLWIDKQSDYTERCIDTLCHA